MLTGPITYNSRTHKARRDILDIVTEEEEEECGYFECELTREPQETSVLTSSPGMPPLKKRRHQTMIASYCYYPNRRLGQRAWKSFKRDMPTPSASFPE
ncbi:hypothetical protein EVAR_44315_1 [Eumeta japonica]|uniref:Uncharacterized protein n=1 Tax=Eumeta variegata TaxID=151549 RepID=A0A4C1X9C1_EUMVA|nr:hypothetical protein EVAR_44315_1 [Eumeta japonica]